MIIGDTFAVGHIPKTGGDAAHAWFAQLPGVEVDPPGEARKHQYFWERDVRKPLYALSIRRLPSWALSYLHELTIHPTSAQYYGLPPGDTVRPECAFALTPDEYLRQHQLGGRHIGAWLRMEHLFDDVVRFIGRHVRPVTADLQRRLESVPTKGRRGYDHDVDAFFTRDQMAALYARNPLWAAVEREVYGGLYGEVAPRRRAA